jgi:protein-S-isoprenylcysteine O-methyltransferase Ste14
MTLGQIVQSILFPYALIYLAVVFVLPSYRVFLKTGKNPYVFERSDSVHDYTGMQMRIVTAVMLLVIIIWSYLGELYEYLVPIRYMENDILKASGALLMLLSFGWIIIAQIQMGQSWRIGFSQYDDTQLIKTGLFRLSRNPVFLGMLVTQVAFFLVVPNAVTFMILFQVFQLLQIQVRLEEEYLTSEHSEEYKNYCQRTRRWL